MSFSNFDSNLDSAPPKPTRKTGKMSLVQIRRHRAVDHFSSQFTAIDTVLEFVTKIVEIVEHPVDYRISELINLIESSIRELEKHRDLVHAVINQNELML